MVRSPMRARSRVTHLFAGLLSALLLLVLIVGIPVALIRLGSGLLPHHVPSWSSVRNGLLHKDASGTLFMQALVVIGWLAWASFALSVLVEMAARVRGRNTVRLPGLGAQQRWAAALITAITLMFASPAIANAGALSGGHVPRPAAVVQTMTPVAVNAPIIPPAANAANATIGTAVGSASTAPVNDQPPLVYHVKHGDYLGAIAQRFEGSFDEYHVLAKANGIANPSHIEAGWTIRLPEGAVDNGPTAHAGGKVTVVGQSPTIQQPPPPAQTPPPTAPVTTPPPIQAPTHAPTTQAPAPVTHAPATHAPATHAPATHAPTAHQSAPAPVAHPGAPNAHSTQVSHDDGNGLVEVLEAAGTLAAVVSLSVLAISRREQLQRRVAKNVPASASGGKLPRLMSPTLQRDMIRVDSSLRALAGIVDGWPIERIPQIAGVWMDHGAVTLMLADDCGPAPRPFVDDANGWMLPADADLMGRADQLAPLPTLVTVGGRAHQHLLLDIEYLRMVGIGGDPAESLNLLRFIAAELTHNAWSDDVRVVLSGFGDEAAPLAALETDRVRVQPVVGDAVARFRRRLARAVATWDAPAGPPEILLIAQPPAELRDDLAALERELMQAPGVGMAVVIGGAGSAFEADRYQMNVGADGLLRVGFLGDAIMPAASLPTMLLPEVVTLVEKARRAGDTSPLDLARAASRALMRSANAANVATASGVARSVGLSPTPTRRAASLAGQHRRAPGQKPEQREEPVDLMRARHVRSA